MRSAMLHSTGTAKGVRLQCRCAPQPASGAAAVAEPQANGPTVSKTISNLDTLLGDLAKPAPTPVQPSAATSAASTSAPSQAGVFSWPGQKSTPVSKPQAAAPARKGRITFEKVMSFEGLAPELINGRAAMLGFMVGITAELKTGGSIYSQLVSGGAAQMLLVILAVSLASFAPAVRQVPLDQVFNQPADLKKTPLKELGPFTLDAELRNGRAAMIAIAVIIILEGTSGRAFFI